MELSEYIFAIATRDGSIFRGFEKIEIIKEKEKTSEFTFYTQYGQQRVPAQGL